MHRLEWGKHGTPIPRRPAACAVSRFIQPNTSITVLDGGHAIALHQNEFAAPNWYHQEQKSNGPIVPQHVDQDDVDDDFGCIDSSRMEQLLSRQHLFGCALCVLWILRAAGRDPSLGLGDLLQLLDEKMDRDGMVNVLGVLPMTPDFCNVMDSVGFTQRPRRFEIGQALVRLRGMRFEELPVDDDGAEEAAMLEAEKRKQELAALWAARRKRQGD